MEGGGGGGGEREFQDWEMLQTSEMGPVKSDLVENSGDFGGIEGDSEGVIRSDYFALDSEKRYARTVAEGDVSEEGSVNSDNPSWVDPGSEPRIVLGRKNSNEFWSDSSSDRSVSRKLGEFEGKSELGFADDAKQDVGFGGIEEKFWSDAGGRGSGSVKIGDGSEHKISAESVGSNGSESSGIGDFEGGNRLDSSGIVGGEQREVAGEHENESNEEVKSEVGEKKRVVWWQVPLELLKFCVFRVSPVWSLSVAAAVMGFVILGRRLYKMKRKSRSIPLKVTVEDKKVSQFMTRAARLNEAFSVVKRVPIIRPSLPAAGVTPWPVLSIR